MKRHAINVKQYARKTNLHFPPPPHPPPREGNTVILTSYVTKRKGVFLHSSLFPFSLASRLPLPHSWRHHRKQPLSRPAIRNPQGAGMAFIEPPDAEIQVLWSDNANFNATKGMPFPALACEGGRRRERERKGGRKRGRGKRGTKGGSSVRLFRSGTIHSDLCR